jgi:protein-S-isoprenylcysteine O-methyltransferase Ste14
VADELTYRILFIVLFALFGGIRGYYNQKSRQGKPRRTRQERFEAITEHGRFQGIFLLVIFWGYLLAVLLYLIDLPWILWSYLPFPEECRWVGIALALAASPCIFWVHRTLGKFFSYALEVKGEHELVKDGPYARIRHPMYTAEMIFNIGMVLVASNWLLLIFWLIGVPLAYLRMFNEEKMMVGQFGDEYTEYMKSTGRLFPKLRKTK